MEEKGTARQLPRRNSAYAKQEYWEERFAAEKHYEWLESPESLLPLLLPLLRPSMLVLTVGCGNSELSDALVASGMPFVFNLDFSRTVLHTKRRHERECIRKYLSSPSPPSSSSPSPSSPRSPSSSSRSPSSPRSPPLPPVMEYLCADMTRLEFLRANAFDVVIDKAAMDALMTEEGSVWEPRISVRQAADGYLAGVGRCLKPGGLFIQITFQQPHFRRRYLLNRFSLDLNEDAECEDGRPAPGEWISAKAKNFPLKNLPAKWQFSESYGWAFFHTDIEKNTPGCFSNFFFLAEKTV
ncbi:methyltransferase domain protein [Toxoplasma gondii VAND]|uniref:Methyltransferase domain protein n=1 Tax=Toxoplasma gondii VAND TaxID=933077 RepID=A0A086PTF5_TOXGO|nr:methyltransferase domain protein [Toxoplasma gondii VAND]